MHLSLCFNPSHLEFVNPVALGPRARPSRTACGDRTQRETCMALLIHGDAAFAGEGIVQETLNLSELAGLHRRRHAARHRQQPDRLHHAAGRGPLQRLRHRRGQDAAEPDLPRQRRGPRGRGAGACSWPWTSAAAFQRDVVIDMYCYRRLRPQRGRRAGLHAAAAVPAHRAAQVGARRLPGAPAGAGRT